MKIDHTKAQLVKNDKQMNVMRDVSLRSTLHDSFLLKLILFILILEYGCLCVSVTKRPQRLTHYTMANTLSNGYHTIQSPMCRSHSLSARRVRGTKSRGPKGLQLEVGAQGALVDCPTQLISYLYLYLCSMTNMKEHSREIC